MNVLRLVIGGLCLAAVVASSAASSSGPARGAGVIPGQYIVVVKPGANRAAAVVQARALGGDVFMEYDNSLNGFAVRLPDTALAGIRRDPRVLFVSPDEEMQATSACDPNVTQCLPTGIDRIDGDRSSTRSGNGRGSVNLNVAVLDTGIALDHPDLGVAGGANCSSGHSFNDPVGHGTHVAGTIAALDNNFGVVGVAPGARLWAVRVLNGGLTGNLSAILCGVDWVTSTRRDGDPNNDIAVASMSLVGKGSDDHACGMANNDPLHLAICDSSRSGVTYVVGAGNSGADVQQFTPAAYDEVLTVTAVADSDGQPGGTGTTCEGFGDDLAASFSNFASLTTDQIHTIAAPGTCVLSTWIDGRYIINFGTSFATPHAAGTVALCIASGSCAGLTPPQIIEKIVSDATAYNTAHPDYGFQGDPLRPISGKYYGYLIRAGLY